MIEVSVKENHRNKLSVFTIEFLLTSSDLFLTEDAEEAIAYEEELIHKLVDPHPRSSLYYASV